MLEQVKAFVSKNLRQQPDGSFVSPGNTVSVFGIERMGYGSPVIIAPHALMFVNDNCSDFVDVQTIIRGILTIVHAAESAINVVILEPPMAKLVGHSDRLDADGKQDLTIRAALLQISAVTVGSRSRSSWPWSKKPLD